MQPLLVPAVVFIVLELPTLHIRVGLRESQQLLFIPVLRCPQTRPIFIEAIQD
jgi:hypothetical protein